jgi:hypothetical protein
LEKHILDVRAAEFGVGRTDNTVPHDFGWNHIGCSCSELVWVIDQISANGDAHAVGIILLGPMDYDNVHLGDGAVFGDAPDFIMGEKKDSVSANSGT